MNITKTEEQKFINYMMDFYGPGGVYYSEVGASPAEIKNALDIYLSDSKIAFEGDTVDREHVRDILLTQRT